MLVDFLRLDPVEFSFRIFPLKKLKVARFETENHSIVFQKGDGVNLSEQEEALINMRVVILEAPKLKILRP